MLCYVFFCLSEKLNVKKAIDSNSVKSEKGAGDQEKAKNGDMMKNEKKPEGPRY